MTMTLRMVRNMPARSNAVATNNTQSVKSLSIIVKPYVRVLFVVTTNRVWPLVCCVVVCCWNRPVTTQERGNKLPYVYEESKIGLVDNTLVRNWLALQFKKAITVIYYGTTSTMNHPVQEHVFVNSKGIMCVGCNREMILASRRDDLRSVDQAQRLIDANERGDIIALIELKTIARSIKAGEHGSENR
jgi:hypothetical protein